MKPAKKTVKKAAAKTVVVAETKQLNLKPAAAKVLPVAVAPVVKATPPATTKAAVTVIEAKIDVGFGNKLFVRGQGAGLSWERGTPLACVDGQTWRWTVPASDKLTFKFLINDAIWAQGEDLVATPGKAIKVTPRF